MLKNNNPKYKLVDNTNIQIGKKLKERRKAFNMTQKSLANELGCTFQQIQKYEAGINKISLSLLLKLCEVLKCTPHYFFGNCYLSDSQSCNNLNTNTTIQLNNTELQLILNFRQLPNNQIKQNIVDLIKNIINSTNC